LIAGGNVEPSSARRVFDFRHARLPQSRKTTSSPRSFPLPPARPCARRLPLSIVVIRRDDQRFPVRRPENCDVIVGRVARAGLVAFAPVGGQSRAQRIGAGLVRRQPACQQIARTLRERIAQQQFLHVAKHRPWRGGVVFAVRPVEKRFDVIQPRERVAERARVVRDAGRSGDGGQQQVGRGVVAQGYRRLAQLRDRHAGRTDVQPRHRRVFQQRVLAEHDAAIEFFLSVFDALQYRGDEQQLERAAHQEALVAAPRRARAAAGVEDRDAEPAAVLVFQRGQPRNHATRLHGNRARRNGQRDHAECGALQHLATIHRSSFARTGADDGRTLCAFAAMILAERWQRNAHVITAVKQSGRLAL
jgi:hypothetical protein